MEKMEQAKCPLCGGELGYGSSEYEDECEFTRWRCTKCNATGTEVCDIKFALHQNVKDADGKEVDLQEPRKLYWVSWIAHSFEGGVYQSGINEAFLNFYTAKHEIEWREKVLGDKLISAWIDCYCDNEKISVPFYKCYIDFVGQSILKKGE